MASLYLQEIQTVQPQGPYFLGGYSFGGIIAYQIAQQLHSQGQEVALLALLDTCRPGYKRRLSFLKRISLHINHIVQRSPKYFYNRAKGWYKHAKYQIEKVYQSYFHKFTDIVKTASRLPEANQYIDIINANTQALNTYVFQPYGGKVTLLRTKDENRADGIGVVYQPEFGWSEIITGELNVKYIPGSHLSLLNEPNVKVLSKQMKICLEQAQNRE